MSIGVKVTQQFCQSDSNLGGNRQSLAAGLDTDPSRLGSPGMPWGCPPALPGRHLGLRDQPHGAGRSDGRRVDDVRASCLPVAFSERQAASLVELGCRSQLPRLSGQN